MSEIKKAAEKQKDRIIQYKQVFGNESGKAVLEDIMKAAHITEPSYVRGDPHESSFREGERNVALRIMKILKINPKQLDEYIREENE